MGSMDVLLARSEIKSGAILSLLCCLGAFATAFFYCYQVAVLGQKGEDYYHCGGLGSYSDASNVLSVAFAPEAGTLYVA